MYPFSYAQDLGRFANIKAIESISELSLNIVGRVLETPCTTVDGYESKPYKGFPVSLYPHARRVIETPWYTEASRWGVSELASDHDNDLKIYNWVLRALSKEIKELKILKAPAIVFEFSP